MKVSNVPVSIVHVHYENAIQSTHVFNQSNDDFFSIVDSKKFKPICMSSSCLILDVPAHAFLFSLCQLCLELRQV